MNVCQTKTAALVWIGQLFVIDAHHVQDGGLPIVNVNTLFDHIPTIITGLAILVTGLHPATGHPQTESAAMMVAAITFFVVDISLAENGSAEFAAEDHQRIVQQSPLLEVFDQRSGGLVGVLALMFQLRGNVGVLVPADVLQLNE